MAITMNYGPTPGLLGGLTYGSGQSQENYARMQQLMQMMLGIRNANQQTGLERERMSLQEKMQREQLAAQAQQQAAQIAAQEKLAKLNSPTTRSTYTPSAGTMGQLGVANQRMPNKIHPLSQYWYEPYSY